MALLGRLRENMFPSISRMTTCRAEFRHNPSPAGLALLVATGLMIQTAQAQSQTTPQDLRTAHATPAAEHLGAEQVIRVILAHNPELRAAQAARTSAQAGISAARALSNPRIEWAEGRNTARIAGTNTGAVNHWNISQFIENPYARNARIDAARASELGSQHQVSMTRNELVAQVRLRVYQGLLHQAQSAAATESVQLLEQVRERVRVRVASGEAARYEIIKADAEIINARERLQTALLMAEQAQLELNRLAAGQLPRHWKLVGDLGESQDMPSLEQIHQQVTSRNPELAALQADAKRAQANLRAAEASRLPGLELRYSQSRDPELKQGQLGIGIQIPLLDMRSGAITQARAELDKANIRLEGRQAEFRQQVMLIWKTLEMARLRIEALSQGSVREAEAALRVAQAAYRFGERGILDVLDAQRVLRSVRADLIDARYQLQAARIALDQLTGQYAEDAPS